MSEAKRLADAMTAVMRALPRDIGPAKLLAELLEADRAYCLAHISELLDVPTPPVLETPPIAPALPIKRPQAKRKPASKAPSKAGARKSASR